ncbi:hypothetical protein A5780_09720 [Nocardia sp. 852002-20019_SCH5090214]|uniref:hypothetical protein n=1 Tax=Nocardia sp. 852002-20019_SCH5090214 TaxID=1834087 RepID=UPI0007EC1BAA|nr:hypothetical protein [Nocardia sp. 852002-20019_SCH5090214]OBA67838.1 hypothetical protein A5780_09720 [Nocardia sp. 852002-20019_SCH5090214]
MSDKESGGAEEREPTIDTVDEPETAAASESDTAGSDAAGTSDTTESSPTETKAAAEISPLSRLRPAAGGRGVRIGLRAAALVLGAAIGSSIYFYLQNKDHEEVLEAQVQARQAACAYGPVVSTYDSKHLDQYVRDVLAGASGEWKKQFESNSKDLSDVLAKGEVVAKSTDVQCAIRSGDKNSAEAIVVIGQTITSLGTQGKPEPGQLSTVMRLQKQGDRWLVDKISTPLTPLPPQS